MPDRALATAVGPSRLASRSAGAPYASWWVWGSIFLAALGLGLAFQGSRGVWEPDEGYYSNAALGMARSHDWLIPRLNGEPFLDKPPLLYWSMGLGFSVFGTNEWGLRGGNALAFAVATLLVGLLAARWWGEKVGRLAALVYATSLGPFLAANVVTPDTLLATAVVAAYYCAWRERTASSALARWGWAALLGAALGTGALAKGPAVLVFALPIAIAVLLDRFRGGFRLGPSILTALVFLGMALPWCFAIAQRLPGAAAYILDNQVLGRLFSGELERNPGPLGGVKVYLPTLAVGMLPWGLVWLRRIPALASALRSLRGRTWAIPDPTALLAGWLLLPLAILLAARSRLPLYVLPLFAPLSMLTARQLAAGAQRGRALLGGLWIVLLLAGKAALAHTPYDKDSRRLAAQLLAAGIAPDRQLVTVDTKKNGLALYGWHDIVQATFDPTPYPFFRPPRAIRDVVKASESAGSHAVFVASPATTADLELLLRSAGLRFTEAEIEAPYAVLVVAGAGPELD